MTSTDTSLPIATGVYPIDVAHSGVHFRIRHLGLSTVRGRFDTFTASLNVGETLDDVRVNAEIDLSSVDTNNADRDAHLASTDFFDVDTNPQMTFASTAISHLGDDEYEMTGDLTIHGVTRPVTFEVQFNGTETFPADGSTRVGFDASTELRRGDFGVDFNMPIGVDKLALGEKVKIELDAQFVAPSATESAGDQ